MTRKYTRKKRKKTVETILHEEASRTYIPTVEYESVMREEDKSPIQIAYERRNHDLDPQLRQGLADGEFHRGMPRRDQATGEKREAFQSVPPLSTAGSRSLMAVTRGSQAPRT